MTELKAVRARAGLTQRQMAIALGIGRGGYAKFEQGKVPTPYWLMVRAINLLHKLAPISE